MNRVQLKYKLTFSEPLSLTIFTNI
ncbi:MAG: hypothetical protein ACFFFT_06730 [Candidatus Thorarchaeota archaeon]